MNSQLSFHVRMAPLVFVARIGSHIIFQGYILGLATLFLCLAISGYYFTALAHMNHAKSSVIFTQDFVVQQLSNTTDIDAMCLDHLYLYLDRQTLHHLFPTIDHSQLPKIRNIVGYNYKGLKVLNKEVNKTLNKFSSKII